MTESEEPQIDPDEPQAETQAEGDPPPEEPSYWPPDPASAPVPNAIPFLLTTGVNLAQLQQEISAASDDVEVGAYVIGPYPDGTMILWLTPPSLDPAVVEQVIDDHVPNPDWGIPQIQKDFQAVTTKLAQNPEADLTSDEVKTIAVMLALQSLNPTGTVNYPFPSSP
jgi:hypothetical protein